MASVWAVLLQSRRSNAILALEFLHEYRFDALSPRLVHTGLLAILGNPASSIVPESAQVNTTTDAVGISSVLNYPNIAKGIAKTCQLSRAIRQCFSSVPQPYHCQDRATQ